MNEVKLKFDLERLSEMSRKLEETAGELSGTGTSLQENMEQLKKDWNTTAGREFFQNQTTTWTEEVERYIQVLETLKSMIDYAIEEYSRIQDLADKLSIK